MGLPNYWHHSVKMVYPDGITFVVDVFFIDGSVKEYAVVTQRTELGLEITKYKQLI